MTIFAYLCRECYTQFDSTERHERLPCPSCGTSSGRDFSSVSFSRTFTPHYNYAVGKYVTSSRDFDEKLKIAGEEAGTSYSRVDPGEVQPIQEADDILNTQMSTMSKKGYLDGRNKVSIDDTGNFVPQS